MSRHNFEFITPGNHYYKFGQTTKVYPDLFFMPGGGENGMACYNSRTYEERKQIQGLWEAGVQAREIAEKLAAPLSSIYSELRWGQDGTRLPNQRMRYDADIAGFIGS